MSFYCCCSCCCFIIAIVFFHFFHYCSSAVQHFGQRVLLLTVLTNKRTWLVESQISCSLLVNAQYLTLNKQFHYYDKLNPSFWQFTKAPLCSVGDPLVMVSGYLKSSRDKFICAVKLILAITAPYGLWLSVRVRSDFCARDGAFCLFCYQLITPKTLSNKEKGNGNYISRRHFALFSFV